MALQFNSIAVLLVVLIVLGVLSNNSSISIPGAILLIIQQSLLVKYLPWVNKYGMKIGIIILTIATLAPLVSGKISIVGWKTFINFQMLLAVLVGILVAWLGNRGINLMTVQPTLLPGLIIGTIIGVAFFKGVPVGPIIAAGILSIFLAQPH